MKTIFGVKHTTNYTCITNSTLQDTQLSWAATGLLTYLLSLPEDWVINIADLVRHKKTTKHEVYKLLKELISLNYVIREMDREGGKIVRSKYTVYELTYIQYKQAEFSKHIFDIIDV
jgi:hypothetical protein